MDKMTKLLCWIGWAEGTSLLLLLFLAMPVKYLLGYPELVRVVGGLHGALFLLYLGLAFKVASTCSWTIGKLFICGVLSCLPAGTFYFEWKYLRIGKKVE